jgi:hypothetical protein
LHILPEHIAPIPHPTKEGQIEDKINAKKYKENAKF